MTDEPFLKSLTTHEVNGYSVVKYATRKKPSLIKDTDCITTVASFHSAEAARQFAIDFKLEWTGEQN